VNHWNAQQAKVTFFRVCHARQTPVFAAPMTEAVR
jgi:hypothetical protein